MASFGLPPGWHVNESQVREILGDSCNDLKQLEKDLCDEDIRDFGLPALADFSKSKTYFEGPIVLQLSKYRNVSQPKTSDSGNKDGIKKVVLTDGMSTISGLTFEDLKGLTSQTPPGTKILLRGRIPVEGGYLILCSKDITVIGGNVEKLVERWLVEKSSFVGSVKSRKGEGAPKWVSFGARSSKTAIATKGFKANDVLHAVNKATADEAFDKERQNRIESAVDGELKKFSAPSTIAPPIPTTKIADARKNAPAATSDKGKDRAPRGRGRNKDPDESDADVGMFLKPAATTLMDFLPSGAGHLSEPPVSARTTAATSNERGNFAPRKHTNEQRTHFDGPPPRMDRNTNVRHGKPERKQFNSNNSNSQYGSTANNQNSDRQQFNKNSNSRTGSSANAPNSGYPKDDRFKNMDQRRNQGRPNNQRPHQEQFRGFNHQQPPSFQSEDFPTVDEALVEELSAMDLGLPRGKNVFYSRGNRVPVKQSGPNWAVGQTCQAPWSDGNYYLATITKLGTGSMCTVRFDEYGDICSVPRDTLLLLK